jgi:hypothetical protein
MATDDDNKSEGAEGDGGREGSRRGTGRNRGERSTGRGGAPSNREIEAAIASLPPERLAALLSIGQARSARGGPATPKISGTLDKLDAEQARDVIAACDEAMDVLAEQRRNGEAVNYDQALAPIRDVSPEVVAAIHTNSGYRQKPLEHSINVARVYLRGKHGDDTQTEAAAV